MDNKILRFSHSLETLGETLLISGPLTEQIDKSSIVPKIKK